MTMKLYVLTATNSESITVVMAEDIGNVKVATVPR